MDNWVRSRWLPVAFVLPFLIGGAVLWSINADGPAGERSLLAAVDEFVVAVTAGDGDAALKAVYPESRSRDRARVDQLAARWRGMADRRMHIEVVPGEKSVGVHLRASDRPELNDTIGVVPDLIPAR